MGLPGLSAPLRSVARCRRRPLLLLTVLFTLVITSAVLHRHTAGGDRRLLFLATDQGGASSPHQSAPEAPLLFYSAARGLANPRKTLELRTVITPDATHNSTVSNSPGTAQGNNSGAVTVTASGHSSDTVVTTASGNTPDINSGEAPSSDLHNAPGNAVHDAPSSTEGNASGAVSVPSNTLGAAQDAVSGTVRADSGGAGSATAQGTSQGPTRGAAPTSSTRTTFRWDRVLSPASAEQLLPLTSAWLWRQHLVQAERRSVLASACRRHAVSLAADPDLRENQTVGGGTDTGLVETIKASHMSVVPPLKTLVCLVNKVASSSLLATFLKLAGHGVPVFNGNVSSPHASAKQLQPEKPGELDLARQHYMKLLFVRHPMDRLISAYQEKVVRAPHKSLHALREAIISTHEHLFILDRAAELIQNGVDLKNEKALQKVYLDQLNNYRDEVRHRNGVPTFQEFLDFILLGNLTGDSFDSHWSPYWRQCAPCHMNYDVISKLETNVDDFKYVWNLLGIYRTVRIPWLNRQQRQPGDIEERLRTYVTPLRADTIRQLRRLFRPDFDMFGYDWRWMLDVSGHCRPGEPCDLA